MLDERELRAIVERHFRVYDVREEGSRGDPAARLYFIMFPAQEFDRRFEAVRSDIRAADREALVFVRREQGEDILFVADRPVLSPGKVRTNLILLVLTAITTVTAGALYWQGYRHAGDDIGWSALWQPEGLLWGGLTFALPLMLILGLHETAHYVVARRHGLRATLPYFIPVPPVLMPIGTLGAFISIRDPLPDRKALFDVGAAGPIAGFLVALPVIVLGAYMTGVDAEPIPDLDRPDVWADLTHTIEADEPGRTVLRFDDAGGQVIQFTVTAPDSDGKWEYKAKAVVDLDGKEQRVQTITARLDPGETERRVVTIPANATDVELRITWEDGLVSFGDPLLVLGLNQFFDNDDYLTHPTFFAGWVGLLVTGINLLPASQLDGGHVARAVFGDRMRYVAYAAVAGLVYLALRFNSWMLMAIFILFMGVNHPPPLNDRTTLDVRRKLLAAFVLAVFLVTFVPRPLSG